MIITRAVLLVGVFACFAAADEPTPGYSHAKELIEKALKTSFDLTFPSKPNEHELPNAKRNYAILMAVLNNIVDQINVICGPTYDDVYWSVVDETVPEVWSNPGIALSKMTANTDIFRHTIEPVVDLVLKYCGKTTKIPCDKAVDIEVKTDPAKYDKAVRLLFAAEDLAKTYLDNTYADLATNNQITRFLLTDGKKELEDLTKKLLNVEQFYSPPVCSKKQ